MSNIIADFASELDAKVKGILKGSAKLVIPDEGSIMLSDQGAMPDDQEADVTMIASIKVFRDIFDGKTQPALAFATGRLKVEGNPMRALKVSDILTS
ncbi:MAG: SCP2 sterol-binding domain-containing protein [Pseudomonadota bacterium]